MYNHIDDVKDKLESGNGIGSLPCAKYMLNAIGKMEKVLRKYYSKTVLPTVYGDGMILNPRCKLVLFEEESWEEGDAERYSAACRRRFVSEYEDDFRISNTPPSKPSGDPSKKCLLNAYSNDPEYQQTLLERSAKRRRNDFDRYIEIPNDPHIPSGLGWWRENYRMYPDLSMMVRDVLAVPASGCAVERQFSISGRLAIWQRNRLSPKVIADSMIYKSALAKTRCPLCAELNNVDDVDVLPVEEKEGTIPEEWMQNWWCEKLGKRTPNPDVIDLFRAGDDEIYG